MRRTAALVGILTMFALGACAGSELPTPPTTTSLNTVPIQEIHASGYGFINLSSVAGATDSKLEFSASGIQGGGRVKGKFRQVRARNGLTVHITGDITCLTVDVALGRARIGGVITQNLSTDPAFRTADHEVGDDVWFRVQDGDNHNDVDGSTTLGFKPTLVNTSAEYCALPFTGLPAWNPATTFPMRSGGFILVR